MTLGIDGRRTAKVTCPYCDFKIYPGNMARHKRACLRRIELRKLAEAGRRLSSS